MARTPPRHPRPTRAASPKRVAAPPAAASSAGAGEQAWLGTLDVTRAMFGASLGGSQEVLKGLCELQQAQVAALQDASERIGDAAGRAADAPDWATLFVLQANLASTQWAQALQDMVSHWRHCMQMESRLLERSRADVARLSQRWIDNGSMAWPPLPEIDSLTAADSDTPLAMLGQAQAAMSELARVWTQGANFAALRE